MKKQILPLVFAGLIATAAAPFATAAPLTTKEKVKIGAKFTGAGISAILGAAAAGFGIRNGTVYLWNGGNVVDCNGEDISVGEQTIHVIVPLGYSAPCFTAAFFLTKSALNDLKAKE